MRNLVSEKPEFAAAQMEATASQNVRVEKPVYHLSLNAAPGEHFSREQWEQIADRVLRDLGLEEHQVLIVSHTDREHEHIHLMVNRVHIEHLRAWSNSHDYARIERSLRHLERDFNLREVPGHHHRLPDQEPPQRDQGLTSGETQQKRRTGEDAWASRVRFSAYGSFRDAESWGDLESRLANLGLRLEKRGRGLVVTDGENQLKASRIHRGRSSRKLEKRYGMSFDDWRERVGALRGAVDKYERVEALRTTLEHKRARLGREAEGLRNELAPFHVLARSQREVRQRLKLQLGVIYGTDRVPETSRELDRLARCITYPKAAETLRDKPTVLGKLAGRGLGSSADVQRREALATVPRAAESVEELGLLRRQIAQALDREMKAFWKSQNRPNEAPGSLTQARWRMEGASQKLDKLLPRVFRRESLPEVADTLKRTRNPDETAKLLADYPRDFGRLLGKGRGPFANQERKDALARIPELANAVLEHGEARLLMIRLFLEARNRKLEIAADRLSRTERSLRRLPSEARLMMAIALAAERIGIRALGQVLPMPREIDALKSAARGLRLVARKGRSLGKVVPRTGAAPVPDKDVVRRVAASGARLARQAGLGALNHLLPLPHQAALVQVAIQTAASLLRPVARELSR